jgi:hypothetical protein
MATITLPSLIVTCFFFGQDWEKASSFGLAWTGAIVLTLVIFPGAFVLHSLHDGMFGKACTHGMALLFLNVRGFGLVALEGGHVLQGFSLHGD